MKRFSLFLAFLFYYSLTINAQALTGTIKGHVYTIDNKPVSKATISITGFKKVQSKEDGTFTLKDVPAGKQHVEVTFIGKSRLESDVEIKSQQTSQINFTIVDSESSLQEVSITSSNNKFHFEPVADLPYNLAMAYYVTDNKCIYLVNGAVQRYGASKGVLKYDPVSNVWSVLTDKLSARFNGVAAYVPLTKKIYIMGGQSSTMELNLSIESVDVTTGEVNKIKVNNPMPSSYGGISVYDNKIYLFGGSKINLSNRARDTGFGLSSVYIFDPASNEFKKLTDMPYGGQTAGAITDGVLYTFGGYDPFSNQSYSLIQSYTISTNTWKLIGKMEKAISATDVALYNDKIFLIGSYDQPNFLGFYDISTNVFKKLNSNLYIGKHATSGIIQNRYLVSFGGVFDEQYQYKGAQVLDLSKYQFSD